MVHTGHAKSVAYGHWLGQTIEVSFANKVVVGLGPLKNYVRALFLLNGEEPAV